MNKVFEETPHCVEWRVSLDSEDCEYAYFTSLKDAQIYAEQKFSQNFVVWLAEIGDYLNSNGNPVRNWMYYWWDKKAKWGDVKDRGTGYPSDTAQYTVEYVPIDKTGWNS